MFYLIIYTELNFRSLLILKTKEIKNRCQDYNITFVNESYDLFVFMIIANIINNPVPRFNKT